MRLLCHEDDFDRLRRTWRCTGWMRCFGPAGAPNPNLRLYGHSWAKPRCRGLRRRNSPAVQELPFPACLAEIPILLPTAHAAIRPRLDQWFDRLGIRPRIAGDFEDSALLAAFGRSGMGAFPSSVWSRDELLQDKGMRLLGDAPELVEHFHLIVAERKIQHPLLQRLLQGAG